MFLLFPVGIIPLLYLSDQRKDREVWRMRTESVRRSLPVFTDQVMILLSCGLILSDAFNRIAEGYRTDPTKNSFFERLIVDCQECAARTNRSLVTILNEKADQYMLKTCITHWYKLFLTDLDDKTRRHLQKKLRAKTEKLYRLCGAKKTPLFQRTAADLMLYCPYAAKYLYSGLCLWNRCRGY